MTTCLSRLKEVRYLTSQIQTLFCVILIVTLAACGGGRPIAEAAAAKEGTAEGTAVSLQAERRTGAFVASVLAMGERRSSPTTVDYLFGIEIQNGDVPQQYVIARVIRAGEATTIIDGEIRLDEILAGARVTPKGTIRLRHDSSKPFDPESIEWEVTGLSMLLPIQEGAELTTPDLGRALFGEAFEALVRVVPTDGRNQVLSYEISNSTVEGSPPVIDAKGRLTWKPNQADFDNTKTLRLVARLASGPAATFDVAVLVAKERLIHEVTLPPLGGSIADSHGRYLIRVEREKGVNALKGALSIVEVYASDGSYIYTIRVSPESGARIKVLDAPLLSARANGPTASGQRKVQISAESTRDLWDCVINGEPGPASDTLSPDIGASIGALSSCPWCDHYPQRELHVLLETRNIWSARRVHKFGSA